MRGSRSYDIFEMWFPFNYWYGVHVLIHWLYHGLNIETIALQHFDFSLIETISKLENQIHLEWILTIDMTVSRCLKSVSMWKRTFSTVAPSSTLATYNYFMWFNSIWFSWDWFILGLLMDFSFGLTFFSRLNKICNYYECVASVMWCTMLSLFLLYWIQLSMESYLFSHINLHVWNSLLKSVSDA